MTDSTVGLRLSDLAPTAEEDLVQRLEQLDRIIQLDLVFGPGLIAASGHSLATATCAPCVVTQPMGCFKSLRQRRIAATCRTLAFGDIEPGECQRVLRMDAKRPSEAPRDCSVVSPDQRGLQPKS